MIANGDVDSPEKARFVLDYTGADAIMIGRAAQGRPWIFQEISDYLKTGVRSEDPPEEWIRDTPGAHLRNLFRFYGDYPGVRIARKHPAWYAKGRRGATTLTERINRAETPQEQQDLIDGFFNRHPLQEDEAA